MTLQPNSPLFRRAAGNLAAVEAEIAKEKASSLGRAADGLVAALARLADHDASVSVGGDAGERRSLIDRAGQALWALVVQREACGLRDVDPVLREYGVPREVYLRMGYYAAPSRR
jgi:hypothetical protein